jgi:Cu/Ag efflux pump CusA
MIDILEIFKETGPGVFQPFAITVTGGLITATFIPQYLLTFEYENK